MNNPLAWYWLIIRFLNPLKFYNYVRGHSYIDFHGKVRQMTFWVFSEVEVFKHKQPRPRDLKSLIRWFTLTSVKFCIECITDTCFFVDYIFYWNWSSFGKNTLKMIFTRECWFLSKTCLTYKNSKWWNWSQCAGGLI